MEPLQKKLKLFSLISTPIGNLKDITLRALEVLKDSNAIVIENYKTGKKKLEQLGISLVNKDLWEINRKNETRESTNLALTLIKNYKTASMISDGGAPLFADPGKQLIKKLKQHHIPITFLPGASSLIAALVLCGFELESFFYAGFLPREKSQRIISLKKLKNHRCPIVFYETPYRLSAILYDLNNIFEPSTKIALCFNLTEGKETIIQKPLKEIYQLFFKKKIKEPFVLITNSLIKK